MGIIKKLDWDTNFFEIKIGKVDIIGDHLFDPILFKEQANDENYELVYIFNYDSLLKPDVILKANLDLVDIMLIMEKKIEKEKYQQQNYDFRTKLTKREIREAYSLAESISFVSRFYKEPKIGPNKAKKLYRTWIDNSIDSSFVDGLFLVKDNNSIMGLHLIKSNYNNRTGHCSLIGVNPDIKGKGIGKNLWEQAFAYWSQSNKIDCCHVPFSLQNKESFNFHLKMGFNKVIETKYIYHFRDSQL